MKLLPSVPKKTRKIHGSMSIIWSMLKSPLACALPKPSIASPKTLSMSGWKAPVIRENGRAMMSSSRSSGLANCRNSRMEQTGSLVGFSFFSFFFLSPSTSTSTGFLTLSDTTDSGGGPGYPAG